MLVGETATPLEDGLDVTVLDDLALYPMVVLDDASVLSKVGIPDLTSLAHGDLEVPGEALGAQSVEQSEVDDLP